MNLLRLFAGLALAVTLQMPVAFADSGLDAQIEEALSLGEDIESNMIVEVAEQLKERFPQCFARFEGMTEVQREQVLEAYQETGYLPQVVSVIRELTGPAD